MSKRGEELADPALYQDFSRWTSLFEEQQQWKKFGSSHAPLV